MSRIHRIIALLLLLTLALPAGLGALSTLPASAATPGGEGFRWTSQKTGQSVVINAVCAISDTNVWAVGFGGVILHYDGRSWKEDPQSGFNQNTFWSISALDENHVWAVGWNDAIIFYDGTKWANQSPVGPTDLMGVYALDRDNVWAVGSAGTILFFDGKDWSPKGSAAVLFDLTQVYAPDANHVWAVGPFGHIIFYDGKDWSLQDSGTARDLVAIDGLGRAQIWVAGQDGTILYYDGTDWVQEFGGLGQFFYFRGVFALDYDNILVVGDTNEAGYGTIYSLEPDGWQPLDSGVKEHLFGVTMADSLNAWACGEHGAILYGTKVSDFYFAEGTCRPGFQPYFTIQNPGARTAKVKIEYMKGDGSADEQTLNVAPRSRATVDAKAALGEGDDAAHDFSARVTSRNGTAIVVERPMYFDYKGKWTGGHDVVGATSPGDTFYFAEGTARPGFDTYITIMNPGDEDAPVTARYARGNGKVATQAITVPARARSTLHPADVLGKGNDAAHDFSTVVTTSARDGIVVERPMYFDYGGGWTGGSDVIGARDTSPFWFLAEGNTRPDFDTFITVAHPGGKEDARVRVLYMRGDGMIAEQAISVAPDTRATIHPADVLGTGDDATHDFSAIVMSTNGEFIVTERVMYFDYKGEWTGGHAVMGATDPATSYYFAEGTCRPDFDPYLTIQNFNDDPAEVVVTYMKGDGTTATQSVKVPPLFRSTVVPREKLGTGSDPAHDFSCKVECVNGNAIVVERPMYFNFEGKWTGGSDTVGFTP